MVKLDKRLKAIIENIPNDSLIADIGTDHGKIAVGAIAQNKAKFAIATDISAKSLNKARILANTYQIQDKMSFREGDGLKVLSKGEANTLIIAGMGAREIIAILSSSDLVFDTYIFVPHQDTPIFRNYLANSLYYISKDYIVECSDKFYSIIVACKCKEAIKLSYKQLMLGQSSSCNNDYKKYLDYQKDKITNLLDSIPNEEKKHKELTKYYKLIKEEMNE